MIQAQNKLGPNLGGAGMSSLALPPPAAPSPPGLPHGLQTHPTQRHARLSRGDVRLYPRRCPSLPKEMSVFTQGDVCLYPRRCPSLPKDMSVFTQRDVRLYPRRCLSLPKEMSVFTQGDVDLYPKTCPTLPKEIPLHQGLQTHPTQGFGSLPSGVYPRGVPAVTHHPIRAAVCLITKDRAS